MNELTGIFFDVYPQDTDLSAVGELNIAVIAKRHIILGDLVCFRKVGIAVVFSVHLGDLRDLTVGGKTRTDRIFHDTFVQLRERSGQADTDRAAVSIRFAAKLSGTRAKDLCVGSKLHVCFKACD